MPKISVIFGSALSLLGIAAFVTTGSTHFTALIPVIFGVPILLSGVLANAMPALRKHLMHVAAVFGLLGTLGGLGMGLPKLGMLIAGTATRGGFAIYVQLAMGVISLIFLLLCVNSFIAARRARLQG